MSIHPFGQTRDGESVEEARIALPSGAEASIISFGAILRDLVVPVTGQASRRVVLGYRNFAGYAADVMHVGATAGRCANRIAGGRFVLDGRPYQLSLNEKGRTHLHGGFNGFGRRAWTIVHHDAASVTLALSAPDGEEGYPGDVEARLTYRLLAPATLQIEMTATTDAPTLVNMAHHSYFTLDYGSSIRSHRLWVAAGRYTPTDETLLPSGPIAPVEGTVYDFRSPKPLLHPSGDDNFMFDINFVLDRSGSGLVHAATVDAPGSPLKMEVHTTEPGLQLYDASGLGPAHPGLDGKPHFRNGGLCLEPQKFPDAVNHPEWPSPVLRPGETYRQITEYRFLPV